MIIVTVRGTTIPDYPIEFPTADNVEVEPAGALTLYGNSGNSVERAVIAGFNASKWLSWEKK